MHLWLILSVIVMHPLHWSWPTCKHMIHLWQLFPPSKGPMQTAPQPAGKQKRLCDDQIHVQGTALFRYLPSEALYCLCLPDATNEATTHRHC